MWNSIAAYTKFCWRAVIEDLRDRRWYVVTRIVLERINKVLQSLLGLGVIALLVLLAYSYRETLLTNKRWSAITLLPSLSLFLGYLTSAIRRLHEKTIADLKEEYDKRSRRIKELSESFGRAYQLSRQFDRDTNRPTPAALEHWAQFLKETLWICYGADGEIKFSRVGHYTVIVPEARVGSL